MKIIYAKDYDELSRKTANRIAAQVILKSGKRFGTRHRLQPAGDLPPSY